MDEARRILGLDAATYRALRADFQRICHEANVSKKTLAGAEAWEAVKARLAGGFPGLEAALSAADEPAGPERLALDVICTDVTKRMRHLETRMTLAEAKNVLGVNPEQSRDMRVHFHRVLLDSSLTCKSEATPQQWEGLKRRWADRSGLVRGILYGGGAGHASPRETRALEVVAKDVMKRIRDDRGRRKEPPPPPPPPPPLSAGGPRSSSSSSSSSSSPGYYALASQDEPPAAGEDEPSSLAAGEADAGAQGGMAGGGKAFEDVPEVSHASHVAFSPASSSAMDVHLPVELRVQALGHAISHAASAVLGSSALTVALGMDPHMETSLLLGDGGGEQGAFVDDSSFVPSPYTPATPPPPPPPSMFAPTQPPCAIYLRLHPSSSCLVAGADLWVATLSTPRVDELAGVAAAHVPGAVCVRVDGLVKDGHGHELPLQIEQDQELAAYLAHLQGATPTFRVRLEWKH
ncbi:hypothetical protein CDD83_2198 [Cordyceps sp. RAO-2017]|nr:hypothetical protein CDD83_2198 [Cordyceps sp. RAO-2017]